MGFARRCQLLAFAAAVLAAPAGAADEPKPPPARCLAFSPDGRLLAAAGSDRFHRGELVVWEVEGWKPRFRHREDVGFPRVAFSPDGKRLALSRFAPETKVFDTESGQVVLELKGHTDHARSVTFAPDGKRIVTGSDDRTVKIWDAASGEVLATLEGHASPVYHVDISPGGALLAAAALNAAKVYLWDLKSRQELHVFDDLGFVPHATFSPDARLLAVGSWTGELTLFDPKTREAWGRYRSIGSVDWSAFSPQGSWLAVATNGAKPLVFPMDRSSNAETKEEVAVLLARFKNDSYDVRQRASDRLAELGPAAEQALRQALASPHAETRVRARMLLRRLSGSDLAVRLEGHSDELECVCFSPDGKLLASGDLRGEIRIWRVGDWHPVATLSLGKRGPGNDE